uniref:hypothetical protein n=1 Tax=Flavobacterium psychrophilum TaxID=96345 RepID=UPI0010690B40|nr:hypothetical protein [Flavobacterium psychrophilum]
MKAIHNTIKPLKWGLKVGNYKLKYNFESNSQHRPMRCHQFNVGNYKLKYNFESNSQRGSSFEIDVDVGNYKLKYNFESNSQLYKVDNEADKRW